MPMPHPQPHTPVPLYSLLLECEVKGAVASLKATQRFLNESESPMECLLRLPVDEDAAIADLTITTDDGRVLKAKVEDKEDAREAYSDAVSSGHTAVLGQVKDDREFELSVGNLAPRTGIQTALSFVVPLTCHENKWLVSIPQWLLPDWPKAAVPCSVFREMSRENQRNQVGFSMEIAQFAALVSVTSLGQPIQVMYSQDRLSADVALESVVLSKPISVEFQTTEDIKPKTQTEWDEATGEYVGMISFIPPLLEQGQAVNDLEGNGDFVLLLDRSGSMSGRAIEMAKNAAILFIKSLSEGSKFNVVSFGGGYEKLFPESQFVTADAVSSSVDRISGFKADMGGTNIYRPLDTIYSERSDGRLPRSLFLLTDGDVEDRDAVVRLIQKHSKQARVHAFGIGNSVDRVLIKEAAEAAKGTFKFIDDPSDIQKSVVSVMKSALLPALSSLEVTLPSAAFEQFPSNKKLPVCYFGELLLAFVNFGLQAPPSGVARLKSINSGNNRAMEWEVPLDCNSSSGNRLHKLWAKHAVKELSFDYSENKNAATLARVKDISKKYGVPSEHTAFICVAENERLVEGQMRTTTISVTSQARPSSPQLWLCGGPRPMMMPRASPPMVVAYQSQACYFGAPAAGSPAQNMGPPPMMCCQMVSPPMGGQMGMPSMGPPMGGPIGKMGPPMGGQMRKMGPPMGSLAGMGNSGLPPKFGPPIMHPGPPPKFGAMMADSQAAPLAEEFGLLLEQFEREDAFARAELGNVQLPSSHDHEFTGERDMLFRGLGSDMNAMPKTEMALPTANQPAIRPINVLTSSLMDIIKREVSGKWLANSVGDLQSRCPAPADFLQLGPDANDLWTTLCVVVLIETKFASLADEWELVVRKARKTLRNAGVEINQYTALVKSQLHL